MVHKGLAFFLRFRDQRLLWRHRRWLSADCVDPLSARGAKGKIHSNVLTMRRDVLKGPIGERSSGTEWHKSINACLRPRRGANSLCVCPANMFDSLSCFFIPTCSLTSFLFLILSFQHPPQTHNFRHPTFSLFYISPPILLCHSHSTHCARSTTSTTKRSITQEKERAANPQCERERLPMYDVREYLYKILVIGDVGTGKTSIIKRYVHNIFSMNYKSTVSPPFQSRTPVLPLMALQKHSCIVL